MDQTYIFSSPPFEECWIATQNCPFSHCKLETFQYGRTTRLVTDSAFHKILCNKSNPRADTSVYTGIQQTGFKPTSDVDSADFRRVDDSDSTSADPQQGGFQQGGFQEDGSQSSQGGFNPPHDDKPADSQNAGFVPPPGQKTTMSSEEFHEIENAIKAARDALDRASSLIEKVAFTPQKSSGFD